ncbi:hemerythrin [Psychromonas sp. RZ22]|uniref:hemerythrin domain-containing protein n=1 Tax=Psychromonas algarum TaxID=2555643 RepID=UPI0010685F85|nr:hemerythrin domain-containing protein [Psychromonas sp. RZ22]TEW53638.1 hemerythrin [Psychromonas sp. RZ22]
MIDRIHQDHKNIMLLLNALSDKVEFLKEDKKIDYQIVKSIMSYLKNYSDKYHHPMENLIYAHYLKYRVVPDEVANRLSQDHQELKTITKELDEMLGMILLDAIISKELFIEKLEQFVVKQKQHLTYEEEEIFPAIKSSLSPDDWLNLNQQWKHNEYVEPLFGDKISNEFKALADSLKLVKR